MLSSVSFLHAEHTNLPPKLDGLKVWSSHWVQLKAQEI